MTTKIILIQNISDIELLPKNIFGEKDVTIFSFSTNVHKELKSQKINHIIADNFLDQDERLELFDKGLSFLNNFKTISNELKFKEIDLLKLFDTHELLSYLVPNLVKFIIVKRIIEKGTPTIIYANNTFKKIILSIIEKNEIKTYFHENKIEESLLWDNITIKYSLMKIPIHFTLSKNNYLKIKKFFETVVNIFHNISLDLTDSTKKSIILLEFNPELWENLFDNLKI